MGGTPGATMRTAGPADAAALLALKQRLDTETSFMLYEPDERDTSAESLAADLARIAASANSAVILAEAGGEAVGYVELSGGSARRSRATAHLVIGVLAAASGRGVGAGLLAEARRWAAAHGLHRLELTVMAHNSRAIRLYERCGFAVEGRRTECLIVNGDYVDELVMAALVPRPGGAGQSRQPGPSGR